jgi:hypothetical protein
VSPRSNIPDLTDINTSDELAGETGPGVAGMSTNPADNCSGFALYETWCEAQKKRAGRKRYWTLAEKFGGRELIRATLAETMRSHYDRLERIADDIARLGYPGASNVLRVTLPRTPRARSGDLGEILATELVEEEIGLRVPVRRLRYKDGREMALRGDDFIGAGYGDDGQLRLLKGEAKSNKVLGKTTIASARKVLCRDDGRCTPGSLNFVASCLLDSQLEEDVKLGRTIRDEVGCNTLNPASIDHMLFTVSGNGPPPALKEDFDTASLNRNHYVVNLRIEDHQDFIKDMFEEAQRLGND